MVSPLDTPCDDDEPTPPPGSEPCRLLGAVLCVVGVGCTPEAEPLDIPAPVLCVVGVGVCVVAVGVCVAGVEVGDDCDVVPDEAGPPMSTPGAPE